MQFKIKNQEVQLSWGLTTIIRYCEAVGMDYDMEGALEIAMPPEEKKVPFLKTIQFLSEFIYAGIEEWAEDTGVKLEITKKDVIKHINNQGNDFIIDVINDYTASTFMGKSLTDLVSEPSDKKEGTAPKKSRQAKS